VRPQPALFGGTFNPIHNAHLRAAEEIREVLDLERVLFIPSADPPHKRAGEERMAPAAQRLAWVRAATAGNPAFEVDPLELERPGPSYTADTLQHFADRFPGRPLFILGWDAFAEMHTWHEPERILALADLAVFTRPPFRPETFEGHLPPLLAGRAEIEAGGSLARPEGTSGIVRLIPITPLEISASEVRRRLRKGLSVRYLLPEPIHQEVVDSGIYGPQDGPIKDEQ